MADFEQSMTISASADDVFEFVSDLDNLPEYLPTVRKTMPQGEGRIRIQGEAEGHAYDSDGHFNVDNSRKSMKWGSDGERDYHGELTVSGKGATSEVRVRIHFGEPIFFLGLRLPIRPIVCCTCKVRK